MRKKNITLIIIIILSISLVLSINYVKADSGWDYDYDSGGSWDSDWGSDWDSGYDNSWDSNWDSGWNNDYNSSYNRNYGSGETTFGEFIFIIIIFTIIMTILIVLVSKKKIAGIHSKPISSDKSSYYFKYNDQQVIEKIGMSSVEFNSKAFNIYKDIQNAWTEFDYKKLRKYTTDEIYNSYVMQLDTLKLKKQKNIMTYIECINAKIYDIKEINGILNIDVYMNVRMYDYVINEANQVVRGTNRRKVNVEYELTFVKSNKKASKKSTICPNCSANIPAITGGKCDYCGSVVVIDAKDFVMSRKTCINQRMK